MPNINSTDLNYVFHRGHLIKPVEAPHVVHGFLAHWHELLKKPRIPVKPAVRQEAKGHYHSLSDAAVILNQQLDIAGTPYHFCVLEIENEILIEMTKFNADGTVLEESLKTITHEEFHKWISDFGAGEGVLFDQKG